MVERRVGTKRIAVVRGDITELEVDAFVHDIGADNKLGSGYGGAIASRAGRVVQDELSAAPPCGSGQALATSAGALKAGWIIHVNGPKFHEPGTEATLARAVEAALARAKEKGVRRLALPPIGTGLYQVPLDLCARVTVNVVARHLANTSGLEEVLLVAADSREYAPLAAATAATAATASGE